MRRTVLLATLVCAAVLPASASASVVTVCPSGCAATTIQGGVNLANPDDTVSVAAGTYSESITVPSGKDRITIAGAQAGNPAETAGAGPRTNGETVVTTPGTAFNVNANQVTIDGLTIRDSSIGVIQSSTTAGLRLLDSIFIHEGQGVVPDAVANQPNAPASVIRHDAFIDSAETAPFENGDAIITGANGGHLIVDHNLFHGAYHSGVEYFPGSTGTLDILDNVVEKGATHPAGSLVVAFGGHDVTIARNTVSDYQFAGVFLNGVDGETVTDNSFTRNVGVFPAIWLQRSSALASSSADVERNDISADPQAAVELDPGAVAGAATVRFNRLISDSFGLLAYDGDVDGTDNWWGCNAGPNHLGCSPDFGGDVSRWLVLSLNGADRIADRPGGTARYSAGVLTDNAGHAFDPFAWGSTDVAFTTTAGLLADASSPLSLGSARSILTSDISDGADVSAKLDGQTVTKHVAFGPAPAPVVDPGPPGDPGDKGANGINGANGGNGAAGANGAPGTQGTAGLKGTKGAPGDLGPQGDPGPVGPQGPAGPPGTCTLTGSSLSCTFFASLIKALVPGASSATSATATLYRASDKRPAAMLSVTRRGKKAVRFKLHAKRKLKPGHYILVVKRGHHRVLRKVVTVRG